MKKRDFLKSAAILTASTPLIIKEAFQPRLKKLFYTQSEGNQVIEFNTNLSENEILKQLNANHRSINGRQAKALNLALSPYLGLTYEHFKGNDYKYTTLEGIPGHSFFFADKTGKVYLIWDSAFKDDRQKRFHEYFPNAPYFYMIIPMEVMRNEITLKEYYAKQRRQNKSPA